jgi:hypothetical protein
MDGALQKLAHGPTCSVSRPPASSATRYHDVSA